MPEITTLWNQLDKSQEMSEVWSPSEEDGLKFLKKNSAPGRYPKHIIIQNRIGYMIMPGIYYFGEGMYEDTYRTYGEAKIDPIPCSRKIAMISDSNLYLRNLLYLAVDETNIQHLYKIQKELGDRKYSVIVNKTLTKDEVQTEDEDSSLSNYTNDVFAEIFNGTNKDWNSPEMIGNSAEEFSTDDLLHQEKTSQQPLVENTAEELMPGLGICDVCLSLKCIFLPQIAMKRYKYAYKSGDKLVLINGNTDWKFRCKWLTDEYKREEFDLRIVEELTVCRREVLHCGLPIDRFYSLIDCREQKIKQIVLPYAYEMLQNALTNILPSEESFESFLNNTLENGFLQQTLESL